MSPSTLERVPAHLRQYIVQQNYEGYDEIDHAVWRFVLLQLYRNLKDVAHPAYVKGLEQTGISIDRIPRVHEMDTCLNRFGWGAVCVDGFIPPRAFQEFQALGIMTIAADMRTADHLAYTPAPDIIHESAGHSPIVPDENYRRFLVNFGDIGCQAFSSSEDLNVYQAIRQLSVIKEEPGSSASMIHMAEKALDQAIAAVSWDSETALLSRLHWWTVEYGLIGSPTDYRIYGAGLLSSVGESYFCHDDQVKKPVLTADCIHTQYDITKPQPQLYVVPDFENLNQVLEEVADRLAHRRGGLDALEMAKKSEETATVTLNSGAQIIGQLANIRQESEQVAYLQFEGPSALAAEGKILEGQGPSYHAEGYGCALGVLEDGTRLSQSPVTQFESRLGQTLELHYLSGVRVQGRLAKMTAQPSGRLRILSFSDCNVTHGTEILFQPEWGVYDLIIGERIQTARSGSVDPAFWPATEFQSKQVPDKKNRTQDAEHLIQLYRRAKHVATELADDVLVKQFQNIHQELNQFDSEHWLLRWNLLESLVKRNLSSPFSEQLKKELLDIEQRHYEEAPISMGLRYLGLK